MRGGLAAALAMGAALAAGGVGVASATPAPNPTDGLVLRPGRNRGEGGHRGKPHLDGKRRKRRNRNHVSRRVRQAHRKARKA